MINICDDFRTWTHFVHLNNVHFFLTKYSKNKEKEFHHLYSFKMKHFKTVNDYARFKWYEEKKNEMNDKDGKRRKTVISSDTLKWHQ